jgi:mannose-6-phosphate isomerase-like protein (cupin superfamily)
MQNQYQEDNLPNGQSTDEKAKPMGKVLNISEISCANQYYRREVWTGEYLQLTVMNIPAGGEIGLELHADTDQMLRIERGVGTVYMGDTKQSVRLVGYANADCAIMIPAGTWHNVINEQNRPLKLYSVYAPPHHPVGTVHKTKFDSDIAGD